jgi:hypothetical protein
MIISSAISDMDLSRRLRLSLEIPTGGGLHVPFFITLPWYLDKLVTRSIPSHHTLHQQLL